MSLKPRTPFRSRPAAPASALLLAMLIGLLLPGGETRLWAGLTGGDGIEITRGPFLQYPAEPDTGMAVMWTTNLPAKGALAYGEASGPMTKIAAAKVDTQHRVLLKNLDPSKEYRYRVEAGSRFSKVYAFKPFPAEETAYPFIVYGDSRSNAGAHQSVVAAMKKYPSRFILHTGDLVYRGNSQDDWDTFFTVLRPIAARMPFFPTVGNHEYYLGKGEVFQSIFDLPANSSNPNLDYFFDTGSARFIVMDNRFVGKNKGKQKTWLEAALRQARDQKKLKHIFVFIHQGIQSSGPHGPDKQLHKNGYLELMKSFGVSLVMSGHDHMYERGQFGGLRYIVTAGGGAPIYNQQKNVEGVELRTSERHFIWFDQKDDDVSFKVVRPDGTLIESCKLVDSGYDCKP